jgi:acyl-[acyl-carrier-protein]-phospholipid O-acyltransferase/long-chain-fatty-acid--[acyl-carrier-protein] ligase
LSSLPSPDAKPAHYDRVVDQAAWSVRAAAARPLILDFIDFARRDKKALAVLDPQRGASGRLRTLIGGVALARALRPHWEAQARVGVLLPPSLGGIVANLAAALAGRTVVNFNYTAGQKAMSASAEQAGVRTVLTSKVFLDKANVPLPHGVAPLWIEEIGKGIGKLARLRAAAAAAWLPKGQLLRSCGGNAELSADDPVTIIFSSGSTGDPKGVPLTHRNIASNVDAASYVLPLGEGDRILGILPLFHAFGYMVQWFALNRGMALATYPNPRDADGIKKTVRDGRATVLITTPTFLQMWLRRCEPDDFRSLRLVITGAERLSDALADAFAARFGVRPLEGYGLTECAPVVAVSTPGVPERGVPAGAKTGFVGRPLPGVKIKIADPDTLEDLGPKTPGMILVKGPNVMTGYLGRPELTQNAFKAGYYVTGDLGYVDDDGLLKISDRLARFAKIGGEMVPHGRIEDALHEAAEVEAGAFAVTSIPDHKKGEQLVVLTTLPTDRVPALLAKLPKLGLPNLWLPAERNFVHVRELPVLGTGKLDLRAVKQKAVEAVGSRVSA